MELYITYFPLGSVNPATASKGGLLVNVVRANNLLPESEDDLPDAYLKISVKGHKDVLRTTPVIDNMVRVGLGVLAGWGVLAWGGG